MSRHSKRRRQKKAARAGAHALPQARPWGADAGLVDEMWKMEAVAEAQLRCFLCGAPEFARLLFTPSAADQRRLGTERGRTAMARYSLCESCYGDPDALTRSGARILARLLGDASPTSGPSAEQGP